MANITLTGTGGLMTRLGAHGNLYLNLVGDVGDTATNTTATFGAGGVTVRPVGPAVNNIDAQYLGADQNLRDGLFAFKNSLRAAFSGLLPQIPGLASATVIQMANEAVSLTALTLPAAMSELIVEMIGNGNITVPDNAVKKNTVSVTVAAVSLPVNTGNAQIIASVVDPVSGVNREYLFPEVAELTVSTDGQSGGTAGSETLTLAGEIPAASNDAWNFPLGSGCTGSLTLCDPSVTGANVLTNSDFSLIPAGVPTSWTVLVGTTGVSILAGGTTYVPGGANCLKYLGDGAELTSIRQLVTGFTPNTVYAFLAYTKVSDNAATGTLAFSLCNGSSHAILADNAGTINSLSVDLSAETTAWAPHSRFFRTPRVMPATTELKIHLTTAINNTYAAFIQCAMCIPVLMYVGGPYLAGFRASTDVVIGDKFTVTVANDLGGKFQTLVGMRWFDMRGAGQQLPSTANGTIAETLVTA